MLEAWSFTLQVQRTTPFQFLSFAQAALFFIRLLYHRTRYENPFRSDARSIPLPVECNSRSNPS